MSDSPCPVESIADNNDDDSGLDLVNLINNLKIDENLSDNTMSFNNSVNSNSAAGATAVPALDIKNLSMVPNFDGNPTRLTRFINASESILNRYFDTNDLNNFQNTIIMNSLLNKLEGRAEEVVAIYGSNSWNDIKSALIKNFGDQRDENCLNQDLVNLKQKHNEMPSQFYERVLHLLNTICNYVDLHSSVTERQSKRDFFKKQALKTFLAGLKDPLGPIIRAMRPTSLTEAMQFITEEDNIRYYQRSNHGNFETGKQSIQTSVVKNSVTPLQKFERTSNRPQFQSQYRPPQFQSNPIHIQRQTNPPPQRFPTNSQVFGKPINVWKPNPNAVPQPKPTPMSITSRNTTQSQTRPPFQNYHQNYGQRPKTNNHELFNTEQVDEPQIQDEFYYEYDEQNMTDQLQDTYSNEPPTYQNFQEEVNQPDTT